MTKAGMRTAIRRLLRHFKRTDDVRVLVDGVRILAVEPRSRVRKSRRSPK
jgi:hypothetical protein